MVKPSKPADTTPLGNLGEARMHDVIGYQVAQASIATLGWFERLVGLPMALRPVEYTMLTLIHDNPGVTGARLARALAVTAPNIVTWVSRLEERGLVKRESSATDRRAQSLRTTAAGAKLAGEATRRLLEGEREAFAHLSNAERAMLVELLHKVALRRAE